MTHNSQLTTLNSIELVNFRSYEARLVEFGSGVNVISGPNASGKTNLLEAIYALITTKSFRAKDPDLVHHGKDFFRVVGSTADIQYALGFSCSDGRTTKKITHNGTAKTLFAHVGSLQATLFEPSDLELVSGPPEQRRRYLDYILCQTDKHYLSALSQYRRVLKQRNAVLSRFDPEGLKDNIFAWDVKLTELAGEIYARRQALVNWLNERISELYSATAGSPTTLKLKYLATVSGDDYASAFMAELDRRLMRDLAAGFTTIGPHREDFRVAFDGRSLGSVASRGETRTTVLALKLAEIGYTQEQTGVAPILLLDDVFSELDELRRANLVERIRDHQTIITTTSADALKKLKKDYHLIKTGAGSA